MSYYIYDNRTTNATKLHGNTCDARLRYMEGLVLAVSFLQVLCTADHVHDFLHCPFPHRYQLLPERWQLRHIPT